MYAKFDPDNLPNKPCISMGRSFWNDQDCQTELPFVCKIEAGQCYDYGKTVRVDYIF